LHLPSGPRRYFVSRELVVEALKSQRLGYTDFFEDDAKPASTPFHGADRADALQWIG